MTKRSAITLLLLLSCAVAPAADYRLETISDGLDGPWCVAFLPDGSFLVTELAGRLKRIDAANGDSQAIAGVPPVYFASQGGLFDVLPHPEFSTNRLIYLSYAEGTPRKNRTVIARAELAGDSLENLSVIFRVAPDKATPVHYGGRMAFLADGTLLLTSGDGFDYREAAQDRASGLGKTFRLNDDGSPASGNPFDEAPAVWSYGHRNAQGLTVSRSGIVYLHEHGPRGGDEINIIRPGQNYGWPVATFGVDYNGAYVSPFNDWEGMQSPEYYWVPSIAPSGLAIYEGDQFPGWSGDLFVGALVNREVRHLDIHNGKIIAETALFTELQSRVRDVRTGPEGALYILVEGPPGKLIRVIPASAD